MSKGKLFIISGPSGVGKSTVLRKVTQSRKDLTFSVSATTREPRPEDKEGVTYYFLTTEMFESWIREGEFLEYDYHNSKYYGTPRRQLEEKRARSHVILDIEPKGAFAVRKEIPEAVLIFIMPPSVEELERRLRSRGDTDEEQILQRLTRAKWEMEQRQEYDYVVVNDQADACAEKILKIIAKTAD